MLGLLVVVGLFWLHEMETEAYLPVALRWSRVWLETEGQHGWTFLICRLSQATTYVKVYLSACMLSS